MKVLVTGAGGVLGPSVVERLVRNGHEVVAAADDLDLGALTRAMDGCDVVCHLGVVGGTADVCAAMQRTGARRLVFASSARTYGANPDQTSLFTEASAQRPAPEDLHGTRTVAAERVILDSGVEAVLARAGIAVGGAVDDRILHLLAGPAIVGSKAADLRCQLIHQDDLGRFLAHACEAGPPGPVNVASPDFVPLRTIAEVLNKRYVEISGSRARKAIGFAWRHGLADVSPGEAADLPRMDVTRLREQWGFECAWSTADSVLDLRRAVTGVTVVANKRIEVPWRLRFPTHHPAQVVTRAPRGRPDLGVPAGELDEDIPLSYPTVSAFGGPAPLPALTLSTHLRVLRAAAVGMLDAFGGAPQVRLALGGAGAVSVAHRIYVNDDVTYAVEHSGGRRRLIERAYGREVDRIAGWAAESLTRAADPEGLSELRLDAVLGLVLDDLAWFWSVAAVGASLEGDELGDLAHLLVALPDGTAPFPATADAVRSDGGHSRARLRAERVVTALGQALAALVRERARRFVSAGALREPGGIAHLTWDELLAPPHDLDAVIETRRAEHRRLAAVRPPERITVRGA